MIVKTVDSLILLQIDILNVYDEESWNVDSKLFNRLGYMFKKVSL